jgi:hypothetical protein
MNTNSLKIAHTLHMHLGDRATAYAHEIVTRHAKAGRYELARLWCDVALRLHTVKFA